MSKIVIAALIYWAVCIVIVLCNLFRLLKQGEAELTEKPIIDAIFIILAAPFVAVFIIALAVADYTLTKFGKK